MVMQLITALLPTEKLIYLVIACLRFAAFIRRVFLGLTSASFVLFFSAVQGLLFQSLGPSLKSNRYLSAQSARDI